MSECPICKNKLKIQSTDDYDEHITNQIGYCIKCKIKYHITTCNIRDSEIITKY